uniref:Interleukin-10 receptor subunit beta n=1 Tax=Geotrypetes seraphini TaxID=260995 RepID=A0A6P8R4G3_GEOSA|nr:interleukin-10 receptor subunit beta [Geotrypetes seraphini]
MSLCCWSLLSAFFLLAVSGEMPKPRNVRMESVNLKHILKWDPPIPQPENMTYTAQYKLDLNSPSPFISTCLNIKRLECDFSLLSFFASYFVRVWAEVQNRTSGCVDIHFSPASQTIIGPPHVTVISRNGLLDVSLSGPIQEYEQQSLQERYGASWTYKVLYWRKDDRVPQVTEVVTTQTTETLSDLDPWTTYCLQVQAVVDEYNQTGHLSDEHCEKTTDDGKTPEWVIIILFLVSMAVTGGLVTASFFAILYIYKKTKYVFFPAFSLPPHLKEYLSKPFYNPPFLSLGKQEETDECCNTCIVVIEETETCGQDHAELSDNTAELLQSSQRHLSGEENLHEDKEYSLFHDLNNSSGNATGKEA